jgi:hypothetical protein
MRQPSEIRTVAAPSIFLIDAPTADVSATAIRRRSAAGESIAGLVPTPVRQHIERHELYATSTPAFSSRLDAATDRTHTAGGLHGQD